MSITKTRGLLYWLPRPLGDVNADQKGNKDRAESCGKSGWQEYWKLFK